MSEYGTDQEIDFLRNIGRFHEKSKEYMKLDILRGYQRSMLRRAHWGGINKLKVEQELMCLIEREVILEKVE